MDLQLNQSMTYSVISVSADRVIRTNDSSTVKELTNPVYLVSAWQNLIAFVSKTPDLSGITIVNTDTGQVIYTESTRGSYISLRLLELHLITIKSDPHLTVTICDYRKNIIISKPISLYVKSICISPNGKLIASVSATGFILHNIATETQYVTKTEAIYAIQFSLDSKFIAVAHSKCVRFYRIMPAFSVKVGSIDVPSYLVRERQVRSWLKPRSYRPNKHVSLAYGKTRIAILMDNLIYVADVTTQPRFVAIVTLARFLVMKHHTSPCFSPDETKLFFACGSEMKTLCLEDDTVETMSDHESDIDTIFCSED